MFSSHTHSLILRFQRSAAGSRLEDQDCLCRSDRDSRGQAVQGVQGEEDVRLALEGARPVPQQLAALQVWRDVLDADGLNDDRI